MPVIRSGRVQRRQLGIVATTIRLSSSAMRDFDLFSDQAVEVIEVASSSAAARSGVQAGDVIVAMPEMPVDVPSSTTFFAPID